MGHSHKEIYLHFVWATLRREPLLTGEVERRMHRCIQSEAERLGAVVLAIGGFSDHVHLVVEVPPMLSATQLMKQVKGVSSQFAGSQLVQMERVLSYFRWQEGYSVFSLSRSHLDQVIPYVQNQKQHHKTGSTETDWEESA